MSSTGSPSTGGLASFLFQGAAPTVAKTESTAAPLWLTQALMGTANAATQLAGQPYQPSPIPFVAQPSQQTQSAWNLASANQGNYQPYLQQAGALTQAAGAPITQSDISNFLNPDQQYITGALTRNLNENILPGVQDKFVGAGQSRSPQEAQVTSNAVRDTNTSIGQSLAGAYQGALSSLLQQRGQQGQLGAQAGQLGALTQQLGAGDVSQLAAAGQGQDTLAQANLNAAQNQFQQQQQWPYQQVGFLSNVLRGMPLAATGSTTSTTATAYPQTGALPTQLANNQALLMNNGYRRGGRVTQRGALSRLMRAA